MLLNIVSSSGGGKFERDQAAATFYMALICQNRMASEVMGNTLVLFQSIDRRRFSPSQLNL